MDDREPASFGHTGPVNAFYFHPDHLGSSSYITNKDRKAVQHMEYLPFGEIMVDEHTTSISSPFKFNGKELDAETGYYYYGARYYDPKASIWLSVDPLAEKYSNINPYVYCAQNPIKYIDPNGEDIIGSDGYPVNYTKMDDGTIIWSPNATSDIIKVGNAMLTTDFGTQQLNAWRDSTTRVNIIIDYENDAPEHAITDPKRGAFNRAKMNDKGEYEEITVTFYDKVIQAALIDNHPGNRYKGASEEEVYGSVGVHERGHNDPAQIKLDKKIDDETQQDKKQNKPFNFEIKFRREYHDLHPDLENKDWEEIYKNRGYGG